MAKLIRNTCPNCGAKASVVLHRQDWRSPEAHKSTPFFCTNCERFLKARFCATTWLIFPLLVVMVYGVAVGMEWCQYVAAMVAMESETIEGVVLFAMRGALVIIAVKVFFDLALGLLCFERHDPGL